MKCDEVRNQLAAFISGELVGDERTAVESHLEVCDGCAGDHVVLARTIDQLQDAPLAPMPPADLEGRVFERISLEPVARLVSVAPLESEPPDDLERRSLDRAGVLLGSRSRHSLMTRAVAPGLAAAVLALGFMGMQWRNDAQEMTEEFGARGETVRTSSFEPASSPLPPGGGASLEVIDYPNDNFGVKVKIAELPVCKLNWRYEVWLSGERGNLALGSFTVPGKETYNFPVGLDPLNYDAIEITHEPSYGSAEIRQVLWSAPIH